MRKRKITASEGSRAMLEARMKHTTPEERTAQAKLAAAARWHDGNCERQRYKRSFVVERGLENFEIVRGCDCKARRQAKVGA